ncbi:MAG TPA: hypothetical protein VK106_01255, partial [Balneolaceae bacterium]|nr:hypothetical protein [Balneolaceae bacterium]
TDDYESYPVWSHDGKSIAFASDRYGNFDVYVISASGGSTKRLTYNSAKDIPYDFTRDDKNIVFGTTRYDNYKSVRFPSPGLFAKLYKVPVSGGRSIMLNDAGMAKARYNKKGNKIIFEDRKGYESPERKHERASVTRDIWVYDITSQDYKKLTDFNGHDLSPVWGNEENYYYTSERNDDNLNIYQASLDENSSPEQLTHFEHNPVRSLTSSSAGTLCFAQAGHIYTLEPGQQPKKVDITLQANFAQQKTEMLSIQNGDITEMALAPDGKEIAFVYRGDIFVTSADGKITRRLTTTPYQERMINFSPDGKNLIYSVEKDSSWDVYKLNIANEDEPYFYTATVVNTAPVIDSPKDEFQAVYSPDGKKIAYLEERNILKVYNTETKKTVTVIPEGVNYSYSDGDQYFTWSPDSKWILANSGEGSFLRSEVDLIKADGSGNRTNLTQSGFNDGSPKWVMDGKAMIWYSSREGMKNPSRGSQGDVYIMFFDQEAFNRFSLSKKELEVEKAKEEDKNGSDKEKEKDEKKKKEKKEPLKLDLHNLVNRTDRLTINSSLLSDYILSDDGEKLYYLAKYEGAYNLWVTKPRTHETEILARLNSRSGGSLAIDREGKKLYVLAGGKIRSINIKDGAVKPLSINGHFKWFPAKERRYIFEHTWKQVTKKLLYPDINGVDWEYYHDYYEQFLPYINNNYDFRFLLSEMLGELNVSHTGGRYSPRYDNPDRTAALGMLYDVKTGGKGLKIVDIITGGPMDNYKSEVQPGDILLKIDGTTITDEFDW